MKMKCVFLTLIVLLACTQYGEGLRCRRCTVKVQRQCQPHNVDLCPKGVNRCATYRENGSTDTLVKRCMTESECASRGSTVKCCSTHLCN